MRPLPPPSRTHGCSCWVTRLSTGIQQSQSHLHTSPLWNFTQGHLYLLSQQRNASSMPAPSFFGPVPGGSQQGLNCAPLSSRISVPSLPQLRLWKGHATGNWELLVKLVLEEWHYWLKGVNRSWCRLTIRTWRSSVQLGV